MLPKQTPASLPGCLGDGAVRKVQGAMAANIDTFNSELLSSACEQTSGVGTILPGRKTCRVNRPVADMHMQAPVANLLNVATATTPYCLPPFMRLMAATPPAAIGPAAAACTLQADPADRAAGNQLGNDRKG